MKGLRLFRKTNKKLTLTSLTVSTSVENVVFIWTDGLFLTLGNIIPPLRDKGFEVVALCADEFVAVVEVVADVVPIVEADVDETNNDGDDGTIGTEVVDVNGSTKSSITE